MRKPKEDNIIPNEVAIQIQTMKDVKLINLKDRNVDCKGLIRMAKKLLKEI